MKRTVRRSICICVILTFSNAYALPTGGTVSAGSASIAGGAGSTTISQSSQNVAINWQGFSIGQKEAVQFVQPNSSAVALNRVLGSDPSSILGSLSANGKVFLVNPNGILFGQGAQVNVGGLVASTLNITDGDFMAGRYKFAGAGNGAILNQGSINADGGYVALLGANVSNEGVISARLGTIALAAGNAMTLDVAGDGLLNLTVDQGAVNALVQNGGLIRADGGQVLLTALAAGGLLQGVVNNTGVIQAQTIDNHNGTIRLLGDMRTGTVNVSGTLDASGMGAGQTGGSVTVTGYHVGLFGGHINASGDAGGGTVLVGGGYQGSNPAVQNASATYTSADSSISADAITNGNGGTAIVWSNDSTRAYGSITARGGAQGGNGGLIETSGHWLDVGDANVNASAPNGRPGMWLLDPSDVTISLAGTSNDALAGGVFTPTAGATASNVNSTALSAALSGATGTDITISTTSTGNAVGNITVVDAITWVRTGFTATTLTLNASGDVNINAAITATKGNLVVCCSQNITVAQLLPFPATQTITTTNGSVLLSAGRNITINGAMTTTDGNVAFCAGGDISINGAMTITRGTQVATESLASLGVIQGLSLSAGNAATGPGLGGGGGAVNITPAGGTITTTQGGGPTTVAPVTITYNPLTYTAPVTDFSGKFTGSPTITVNRLVFPEVATKTFDNTTTATFTGLKGSPAGVTLNAGGSGTFDTAAAGANKLVTFTGLGITGAGFALATGCCGTVTRTTGNIIPAVVPPIPDVVPPVVVVLPPDVLALPFGVAPGEDVVALQEHLPEIQFVGSAIPRELPGVNFSVTGTGVRMPATQLVLAPPVKPAPVIVPPVAPPVQPAPVFVPPPLPPRRDRN